VTSADRGSEGENGCRAARRVRGVRRHVMPTRSDTVKFTEHVFARATGEASDENAAVALADGETWITVCMSGAAAHRNVAGPRAAQGSDNVDEFLRWSFGCKRHNTSAYKLGSPLLFPFRSLRTESPASAITQTARRSSVSLPADSRGARHS